jgi:hypothetical protein
MTETSLETYTENGSIQMVSVDQKIMKYIRSPREAKSDSGEILLFTDPVKLVLNFYEHYDTCDSSEKTADPYVFKNDVVLAPICEWDRQFIDMALVNLTDLLKKCNPKYITLIKDQMQKMKSVVIDFEKRPAFHLLCLTVFQLGATALISVLICYGKQCLNLA